MMDEERLAAELDSCLERVDGSSDGLDARLAARVESLPAASREQVLPLARLAADLAALGPVPGPDPAFAAALGARLAAAPRPSSLEHAEPAALGARTDALVRALDACLERVRRGGIDPAVALADHPELADELRPLLATALDLSVLEPESRPTPAFRAALADALGRAPWPRSLSRPARQADGLWRRLWRSTAFTAAAAATVVLMVGASAVYASASARPGDWLYPLKLAAERASLWAIGDESALEAHMALADRRLEEALDVPAYAGGTLSQFSAEVTAALATGDALVASGVPRERVATPLIAWLLRARGRLVDGRPVLPPTAWRGALALVDEAIRALREGRFSEAPVPRLDQPSLLARAAAPVSRPRRAAGPRRSDDTAAPTGGDVVVAGAGETASRPPAVTAAARPSAVPARAELAVAPPPDRATTGPPLPTDPPAPGPTARRTEPRRPDEPTEPPARPSAPPTPEPTTAPVQPTAIDTPSATPTTAPVQSPTAPPSVPPTDVPTPEPTVPVDMPPVIASVTCDDRMLLLGKSTVCHAVASDPEGAPLEYLWVSDVPQMVNERRKDATYYAAWGVGGGTMTVRIVVYVSDEGPADADDPGAVRGETYVEVRLPDAQAH